MGSTHQKKSGTVPVRIAVCIGGTATEVAALDGDGRILDERPLATISGGDLMAASRAAEDRAAFALKHWDEFAVFRRKLLAALCDRVRELAGYYRRAGRPVAGVGISAPGAIHPHTGEVIGRLGALNLPAWGAFNLRKAVEKETGLAVRTINDAKAMALGALACMNRETVALRPSHDGPDRWEERLLKERGSDIRTFIELDPGTGLGGAYVVDGRIWFGPDPDHPDPEVGEIWKLEVDPRRPGINLEALASGRATLDRVAQRIVASGGGSSGEALLSSAGGRVQSLLADAPPHLLPCIEEEVGGTGWWLAKGIRFLLKEERKRLHAPQICTFLIGGGLVGGSTPEAARVRGMLYSAMMKALDGLNPVPQVFFTRLGGRAGIYGSAALLGGG